MIGVARPGQIQDYEARGWVRTHTTISGGVEWSWFVDPDRTCCKTMRGGEVCAMDKGHRGRHASHWSVFYCDSCDRVRRGRPAVHDDSVSICFMCYQVTDWITG